MIYSDGLFIFFLTKLREQLKYEREKARCLNSDSMSQSKVYVTNNQVLGFIVITVGNAMN